MLLILKFILLINDKSIVNCHFDEEYEGLFSGNP